MNGSEVVMIMDALARACVIIMICYWLFFHRDNQEA
jgi:hypothetical protein